MPQTISITIDAAAILSLGLAILLVAGAIFAARIAMDIFDVSLSSLTRGLKDLAWLRFRHDPMMRASLRAAIEEGFDRDDDPFEFFAAGRDLVMDEALSLLGDEPDAADLAAVAIYMRRADVLDVAILTTDTAAEPLKRLFAEGPGAIAATVEIPESLAGILSDANVRARVDARDAAHLGDDIETELAALFGPVPDIPTLAGLALALEASSLVTAARITTPPAMRGAQEMLDQLMLRDPDTGRPLISMAEMDFVETF